MKKHFLVGLTAWFAFVSGSFAQNNDTDFNKLAEEFISGYLAARPLEAVALGFHEYDGKLADCSRAALDVEIARLKSFDEKFQKFDAAKLSPQASIDLRILRAAIKNQLFHNVDMAEFERDPMAYINVLDLNVYLKRNFAPLEDRVRSIIAVENQVPNLIAAAKTNLRATLPRPYLELALEITKGSTEFLQNNLVQALTDLKNEQLRAAIDESNKKAIAALQLIPGSLILWRSNLRLLDSRLLGKGSGNAVNSLKLLGPQANAAKGSRPRGSRIDRSSA